MSSNQVLRRIKALPCWTGRISAEPLPGGITNLNYRVRDERGAYVVRLGDDIVEHQVMRFNELAAARAAHAAGLGPAVIHAEPGATVLQYIESRALTPGEVSAPDMLLRVLDLVKRFHRDAPGFLRGPVLIFWVFHVIRDYAASLAERNSRHVGLARELVAEANQLEAASGPFDMVLGHNDLLAANILDDGQRLWLIDFDYAGFNSPLFDLGGLASNNALDPAQERTMLENYFETPITDALLGRYGAMKCASLLRETMWSMLSELTSELDFDYAAYTAENLARYRACHSEFQTMGA